MSIRPRATVVYFIKALFVDEWESLPYGGDRFEFESAESALNWLRGGDRTVVFVDPQAGRRFDPSAAIICEERTTIEIINFSEVMAHLVNCINDLSKSIHGRLNSEPLLVGRSKIDGAKEPTEANS
jgi:hypothetical protein